MDTITAPVAPTYYLPAAKAPPERIESERSYLRARAGLVELLDAEMGLTAVLNAERQILFVNRSFLEYLGLKDDAVCVGRRIGQVLDCVHADEKPAGCGTTPACVHCPVAHSMARALDGDAASRSASVEARESGRDHDLKLSVSPVRFEDRPFILLSAVDVSHETRRRAMEQIFFHDVINTAGGVQGLLHLMSEPESEDVVERFMPVARAGTDTLVAELLSQRDLARAETGELTLSPVTVNTHSLLSELVELFRAHPACAGRTLELAPDAESVDLLIDKTLLSRVLSNLIKNALEAEAPGARVRVGARQEGDQVVFTVRNPAVMSDRVKTLVFHRSFSTKGAGRGLGTYSARLLTERWLGGNISFVSDGLHGTEFRAAFPAAGGLGGKTVA